MVENVRRYRAMSCQPKKTTRPLKATFIPGVTKNPKYDHVQSRLGEFLRGKKDKQTTSVPVPANPQQKKTNREPLRANFIPGIAKNCKHDQVPSRLTETIRPVENRDGENGVPLRRSHSQTFHYHQVEWPCDGICAEETVNPGNGNANCDSGRSSTSSTRTSRGVNTDETRIFQDDGFGHKSLRRVRSMDRIADEQDFEEEPVQLVGYANQTTGCTQTLRNPTEAENRQQKITGQVENYLHPPARKSAAQINRIRNEMSRLSMNDTMSQTYSPLNNPYGDGPTHPLPHNLGTVPKYLKQRQQEWKVEAEAKKEAEKFKDVPPGHVQMSESERIETLNTLQRKYDFLIEELNRIPIRMDTVRVRDQKIRLEQDFAKVEQAMRVFSRPRVFIRQNQ